MQFWHKLNGEKVWFETISVCFDIRSILTFFRVKLYRNIVHRKLSFVKQKAKRNISLFYNNYKIFTTITYEFFAVAEDAG